MRRVVRRTEDAFEDALRGGVHEEWSIHSQCSGRGESEVWVGRDVVGGWPNTNTGRSGHTAVSLSLRLSASASVFAAGLVPPCRPRPHPRPHPRPLTHPPCAPPPSAAECARRHAPSLPFPRRARLRLVGHGSRRRHHHRLPHQGPAVCRPGLLLRGLGRRVQQLVPVARQQPVLGPSPFRSGHACMPACPILTGSQNRWTRAVNPRWRPRRGRRLGPRRLLVLPVLRVRAPGPVTPALMTTH
jgi:hypothetical protein